MTLRENAIKGIQQERCGLSPGNSGSNGPRLPTPRERPGDCRWSIVEDSPFNRRITADTPMEITGPARGHDLLKTAADPSGTHSLGTWNNCGNGRTPWGTYLTCEENFNCYFSSSDPDLALSPSMKRYGIGIEDRGYAWATTDERFEEERT